MDDASQKNLKERSFVALYRRVPQYLMSNNNLESVSLVVKRPSIGDAGAVDHADQIIDGVADASHIFFVAHITRVALAPRIVCFLADRTRSATEHWGGSVVNSRSGVVPSRRRRP